LLFLGVGLLTGAGIGWLVESGGSDRANWAPTFVMLGAGAFLVLLAVIVSLGETRQSRPTR
jgi:predicted acyltransferase